MRMLPAPIHERAVAHGPPTPLALLSPLQLQKCQGTEQGSHETPCHADLRCDGLQEMLETCVLQHHRKRSSQTVNVDVVS